MVVVLFQTGIESIRLIRIKPGERRAFLPLATVHLVLPVCNGIQRDAVVRDLRRRRRGRRGLIRLGDPRCGDGGAGQCIVVLAATLQSDAAGGNGLVLSRIGVVVGVAGGRGGHIIVAHLALQCNGQASRDGSCAVIGLGGGAGNGGRQRGGVNGEGQHTICQLIIVVANNNDFNFHFMCSGTQEGAVCQFSHSGRVNNNVIRKNICYSRRAIHISSYHHRFRQGFFRRDHPGQIPIDQLGNVDRHGA